MPITVTCDECSESHRVKDDALGKRFKCKGCGKSLKVEAAAPPEDDLGYFDDADLDDDADESDETESYVRKRAPKRTASSGRRKATKSSSGKSKPVPMRRTMVPLGIDCVCIGFAASILVMLIAFAVTWSSRGNPGNMIHIAYGLSLVALAATVVTTVGKLMCLTAPSNMSGRGSIFAAVAIDVLSLSIAAASLVTVVPPLLQGAVNLLSLGGFVCFIVFLQNLGDFLGERDLRERGAGILQLGIGIVVLLALQIGLAAAAQTRALPPIIAGLGVLLLLLVLLVVGILFVVRYGGLLLTCRDVLSNC